MDLSPPIVRDAIEWLLRVVIAGMLGAQVWAALQWLQGRRMLPSASPRGVPWSIRGLGLVMLLYVVLGLGVEIVFQYFKVAGEGEPAAVVGEGPAETTFAEKMVLVSVVNALTVVLVPLGLRIGSGARLSDLGLSCRDWGRDVMTGVVAFLVVSPWVYAVNGLALLAFPPSEHPLASMLKDGLSPVTLGVALASAVLFAPLAEELLFRGVLLGWLCNPSARPTLEGEARSDPEFQNETVPKDSGDWKAIVASSLPFALLHATQMPAPFAIFVLSLALGLLARRTGGLVAPLVLHALFNGFSTMVLVGRML